ncbi:MAG: VWA domain-containing protein [Pirellulaceae bacterium]
MKIMKKSRTGAMLPLIAVSMVVLFAAVTLSVDIARIHVTRAELRTATDAAARAGAEALSRTQDVNAAIDRAIQIANLNQVAGKNLRIRRDQVSVGQATPGTGGLFNFDPNGQVINAIRVTGTRTAGSPDGPVGLMFGPLFGVTKFEPSQTSSAVRTDRDIALVLDVSGSMNDFGRFPALQNALNSFLTELSRTSQKELVSLTVYSTTSRKKLDLTTNLAAISSSFSSERPAGFTAIGEGLKTGIATLKDKNFARPFASKTVILMTDGNQNTGESPDAVALRNKDITVHTITFSQGANQSLMRRVADITGGTYLHAETNEQLERAFREIARQLAVLLID